jgi:type IV pilus assembly protein PilY1
VLNQLRLLNGGAVYCPDTEPCIGKRLSPPYSNWPDKGSNTANDSSGWPDDNLQFLLDDVAKLLHTQDLQRNEPPVVGDFDTSGMQTLRIHTIAYSFQSNLLKNTALVGGGLYFTAHDATALRESLLCILSNPDTQTAVCAPTP